MTIDYACLVNRQKFMGWVNGDLLYRDSTGKCIINDDISFEEAEKIMDKGGVVGLTDDFGRVISFMKVIDGSYQEFR